MLDDELCMCDWHVIEEGYHPSPCYCMCHPAYIETDPDSTGEQS